MSLETLRFCTVQRSKRTIFPADTFVKMAQYAPLVVVMLVLWDVWKGLQRSCKGPLFCKREAGSSGDGEGLWGNHCSIWPSSTFCPSQQMKDCFGLSLLLAVFCVYISMHVCLLVGVHMCASVCMTHHTHGCMCDGVSVYIRGWNSLWVCATQSPSLCPDLHWASAVGGFFPGMCPLSAGLAALGAHCGQMTAAKPQEGLAEAECETVTHAHLSWGTGPGR